jgi:hypothetical protein
MLLDPDALPTRSYHLDKLAHVCVMDLGARVQLS